jgi:hypothetical protein
MIVCLLAQIRLGYAQDLSPQQDQPDGFYTNEEFINGLYDKTLDLTDSLAVFKYVFSHLRDRVTVYPIENYYYFVLIAQGKTFWGSMSFFPHERDSGVIGFGYIEKRDKHQPADPKSIGGWGSFGPAHGVSLQKIDQMNYSATVENKKVLFHFNDVGVHPPIKAKLLSDEIYVGPSFDESGLKFFLIFNSSQKKLYWVLNEDDYVPESFTILTSDIVIGDRTEFAFYDDRQNNRKVLFGVEGYNTLNNNWYDGPFDQMPDNYVLNRKVRVKQYIEEAYPHVKGKIDQYGNYQDRSGARVAVAPYLVYFSKADLIKVIKTCKVESKRTSEFYSCITQQVFIVPSPSISRPPRE